MNISNKLIRIFEAYCHVNASGIELLAEHCKKDNWSYAAPSEYEDLLRDAIKNRRITLKEYDEITKEEFDSEEELYIWLNEIWEKTVGKPL
ncbi:MAG: hypothetical protein PQJ50_11045 [Spirochaetales bacterium]|nr:hypothetical protein [Spirochaetales bacterium]